MKFNFNEVKMKASNMVGRAVFTSKKYAPDAGMVLGTVGVVVGTVWACKQTLTVNTIIDAHKENLQKIDDVINHRVELKEGAVYTEKDRKHDLYVTYMQTSLSLVKHYFVPAAIEVASLLAMHASYGTQKKNAARNATLLAAVTKELNDYRQRWQNEVGPEKEQEMFYDLKKKEVVEETTDKKGNTKTEAKSAVDKTTAKLPFSSRLFFPENNFLASEDPQKNLLFFTQNERYFNDLLKLRGYVEGNEVLRRLGYTGTANMGGPNEVTNHFGWTYDRLHPNAESNHISFGVGDNMDAAQFQHMYNDNCFILNFNWYNIDGKIDWNYVDSDRYTEHLKKTKGF